MLKMSHFPFLWSNKFVIMLWISFFFLGNASDILISFLSLFLMTHLLVFYGAEWLPYILFALYQREQVH